jgi:membrane peptidoglycan carboxypeptidase
VISEDIAARIREVLIGAVEEGTGQAAALGAFALAGKTGTVRMIENGRYKPGAYIASFAGYFPAHDPQLVFLVKLDEPRGAYYGGSTAAPVTRATLEAALAARSTAIDRAPMAKPTAVPAQPQLVRASGASQVVHLGVRAVAPTAQQAAAGAVPDVAGMSMRDGVVRLHAAGLRVRVTGSGRVVRTIPAAGIAVKPATVVRVIGAGAV